MLSIYIPSLDEDLTETGQFTLPEFCKLLQKHKENPDAIEWLAEMLSCANVEALKVANRYMYPDSSPDSSKIFYGEDGTAFITAG